MTLESKLTALKVFQMWDKSRADYEGVGPWEGKGSILCDATLMDVKEIHIPTNGYRGPGPVSAMAWAEVFPKEMHLTSPRRSEMLERSTGRWNGQDLHYVWLVYEGLWVEPDAQRESDRDPRSLPTTTLKLPWMNSCRLLMLSSKLRETRPFKKKMTRSDKHRYCT